MASKSKIVVVEDHHALREAMLSALTHEGYQAVGVMSAEELDHQLIQAIPDIYVLDLNLPGEDGLSLSIRLRELQPSCGIIMLTARNLKQDRIQGYKSGADIYLMKPTDLDELLAAVDSLDQKLERSQTWPLESASSGKICLHSIRRELVGPLGQETLTSREVAVIFSLLKNRARQLEHWEIIELFGENPASYQKTSLEVAMTRLRQKLEKVGCPQGALTAVRGRGYSLNVLIRID